MKSNTSSQASTLPVTPEIHKHQKDNRYRMHVEAELMWMQNQNISYPPEGRHVGFENEEQIESNVGPNPNDETNVE